MPDGSISDSEALVTIGIFAALVLMLWIAGWHTLRLMRWGAGRALTRVQDMRVWHDYPIHSWIEARLPRTYAWSTRRLTPTRFAGLPLTLFALAAIYLASLFGGLVEDVLEAEEIEHIDKAIFTLVAPFRNPMLVAVFRWITEFGAMPALTAVAIVSTGFLWADRRPQYIAPVWLTVIGSQATTWGGKFIVHRPRPDFVLDVFAYSPSFPSAHTTGAVAVYGIVAYALLRDLPTNRARYEVAFWSCVLIALVSMSRVFLSVHYPTDVAAGLLVGVFWLLAGVALAETTRTALRVPENEKPRLD